MFIRRTLVLFMRAFHMVSETNLLIFKCVRGDQDGRMDGVELISFNKQIRITFTHGTILTE